MFFRWCSFLLVVFVYSSLLIQYETEAKPFLEFFFDTSKVKNSYYKHHHHHHGRPNVAPAPPQPVGGKERFKQICNVINGIDDCYA